MPEIVDSATVTWSESSGDLSATIIVPNPETNVQAGTTYTLTLSDSRKIVATTSSSAVTITVPTNASVAFPVGSVIAFEQRGTGVLTFAGASGVTISSLNSNLSISGRYGTAAIRKTGTNDWILAGALA